MGPRTLLYLLVVSLTWVLFRGLRGTAARQTLMLGTSYLLYGSWGLGFLGLLITSSLVNYGVGAGLRRHPTTARLWAGITLNVVLLATFKYLPGLAPWLPATTGMRLAQLVLPLGISFWTFQALSYLIDVYQGRELDPTPREFLLYMAFWPTVLSGPICRLATMLPQFRTVTQPSDDDLRVGFDRIAIGLFMTALGRALANGILGGPGVETVFDGPGSAWTGPDVWCLAIGYGFDLFFNFAGYSHMVIGAARLFGYRLDENFSRPYLARTPSEFWTRWHMSLSSWIRDYLFFPLVMLRREMWWRSVTLVVSMVVFGLWHKGTLLLALWGTYHGLVLVLHRQGQQWQRWTGRTVPTGVAWLLTFGVIGLGWIFFRSTGTAQAVAMWHAVLAPATYAGRLLPGALYVAVFALVLGYFATLGALAWLRRRAPALLVQREVRVALYAVAFYVAIVHTAETQSFIYFQF